LQFVIEQRFAQLEKLVVAVQAKNIDEQMASYLCKLGSVLVCGNLEKCIEHLLIEKVGGESQPRVTSFLKSHFKIGRNYDCENIQQLMFRFDSDWGRKFEKFVEENSRVKEGVSSCYAIRNSVAHGGGQSLGPSTLKEYYEATLTLVAELEKIIR
jgi:RiboL-PSP-HEPN